MSEEKKKFDAADYVSGKAGDVIDSLAGLSLPQLEAVLEAEQATRNGGRKKVVPAIEAAIEAAKVAKAEAKAARARKAEAKKAAKTKAREVLAKRRTALDNQLSIISIAMIRAGKVTPSEALAEAGSDLAYATQDHQRAGHGQLSQMFAAVDAARIVLLGVLTDPTNDVALTELVAKGAQVELEYYFSTKDGRGASEGELKQVAQQAQAHFRQARDATAAALDEKTLRTARNVLVRALVDAPLGLCATKGCRGIVVRAGSACGSCRWRAAFNERVAWTREGVEVLGAKGHDVTALAQELEAAVTAENFKGVDAVLRKLEKIREEAERAAALATWRARYSGAPISDYVSKKGDGNEPRRGTRKEKRARQKSARMNQAAALGGM